MAYGNVTSQSNAYLGVLASTTDEWINAGTNGIDLFSSHSPLIAVLYDKSQEPGGDYQFQKADGAMGDSFRISVYGQPFNYSAGSTPARGVTHANQVNGFSVAVDSPATVARYDWAHYEGMVFFNYEDMAKNSGASQKIDMGQQIIDSLAASFWSEVGIDLEDNAIGAADKVQSINHCISAPTANTVGGIVQNDNTWWQSQTDSTTETMNTTTFDKVRDACTFDTGRRTGIRRPDPDMALAYGSLYSTIRQELKASQRIEVSDTLSGGGKYLMYDGCRIYRTTKGVSGSVCILNSSTWTWRYKTLMPEPVAPSWVPTSLKPSIMERGYNWLVGLGCYSPKHNGYLSNKSA